MSSSRPSEFDDVDQEQIDDEERKAYTAQDRMYDSDPEGDKTPEDEREEEIEYEDEEADDDDDQGFVQEEDDEEYIDEEEDESPSSNVAVTNVPSDIISGDRRAKLKATQKLSSPQVEKKENITQFLSSAAAKPVNTLSRQSNVDSKREIQKKRGLASSLSSAKVDTVRERSKGTSRPAVPIANQMLVKQKKKPQAHLDQLKFIKVEDGSAHSSTSFPSNFVSSEWLVYRNNRPLTSVELATLMAERSSASDFHKQMIVSKLKAFGKAMENFCAVRDQRNALFLDAQGNNTWPFPQRPLTTAEVDRLRVYSSRMISAFSALEHAASTFATVEVSRLIHDQSEEMQVQIATFYSQIPESLQKLFGLVKTVGFGGEISPTTHTASHSSASSTTSSSVSSASSVSQPKLNRSVQTNKKKGNTKISVNASEVGDSESFFNDEENLEAKVATTKFESVSVRLSKSHDDVDKYKDRHGAAVEVEASKEDPCPKLTHKKYTLLRLCPMRKNDFNVIDTSNHARAFVLIQENKNERVVPAYRCHICSLPSFWHLQAPACSVPVDQREDVDGFCSSCGYDINHVEHEKKIALSKHVETARKVEMKKRQEKSMPVASTSVEADKAEQVDEPATSSSVLRRSQRGKKKMPSSAHEVVKTTKKRRRTSRKKEKDVSKSDSEAETASPTVTSTDLSSSSSSQSSSVISSSPQAVLSTRDDAAVDEEAVDYENYDEDNLDLAPVSEDVPRMSMLRNSFRITPSTSKSNSHVSCPYSIEDLALTQATQCKLCGREVKEHTRKGSNSSTKSPKIPKESELPVFRDPAKKEMADPEIFVQRFEERMAFFGNVSVNLKKMCFRRSLTEKYLYDWASTCIDQVMPWITMKLEFIKLTTDPVVVEQRKRELKDRRQKANESVFKFTSDFIHLAARLQRSDTDQHLIEHLYDGLLPSIRKQVTFQRNVQAIAAGLEPTRSFSSLKEVADAAILAERVIKQGNVEEGRPLTPRTSTTKSRKRKRNSRQSTPSPSIKQAKLNDGSSHVVNPPDPAPSVAAVASARTVKLEAVDGKPTNVNKKKKKTVRFADPPHTNTSNSAKPSRRCLMCGKEGHAVKNCFENKKLCRNCGGKEHTLAQCPIPRQSVCRVPVPSLALLIEEGKTNRRMLVSGPLLGSKPLLALYDTGAMFSGISARLCKQRNLKITSPTRGGDEIHGATHGMSTKRIGIVVIDVIIHFSNSTGKAAMKCTKEFEVLNLNDEHFIIGQDMSAELFPGEEAWKFGAKWAEYMTTRPTDVVYLTPNRPRAATLNDVSSESKSESDDEDEDDARVKAVVSNLSVDDSSDVDDDDAHYVAALSPSESQDE